MKKRTKIQKQAKDILGKMTLKEKVYLMSANETIVDYIIKTVLKKERYNKKPYIAGGCKRLGVPAISFCDGPRGVCCGQSTCFPVSMARGATFNPELEEQVGTVIGKEVRSHGGNFFAGVCLNVPYHPGDGRSQETYSEDSYHIGVMGKAIVRGVQSQNVAACIKHYAFNSMECSRFKVDVTADKRTEREVYLPHFKECLDEGALALMSSYNKYQGTYLGHHQYLLREVAKEEWGFEGPVMSDFLLGVRDTVEGIRGGLDIEMRISRVYSYRKIRKALRSGGITEVMVDDAAYRILQMLLMIEEPEHQKDYSKSLIACKAHTELAKKVAEEAITLIRNEDILPLSKDIKKLVLIGDLANEGNIGDHGSSGVTPPYIVTLVDAMKKEYPEIDCEWISTEQTILESKKIAAADAAVIVCGCRHCDEGEFMPQRKTDRGGDRESLKLHENDLSMLEAVSKVNINTAVILMGGNVLMLHDWKDKVKAILMAYYPGMEGGTALAHILMGDVNPSGKLPFAIAAREDAYPEIKWDTEHQFYDYYHGYQKLDRDQTEIDYPFGFGLSYTKFTLADVKIAALDEKESEITVTVSNHGTRAGAEVIQLYIGYQNSVVTRPTRTLRGFQKVFLQPGETKTVHLNAVKSDLSYYDEKTGSWVEEDIDYIAYIGTDEQNCISNALNIRFEKGR